MRNGEAYAQEQPVCILHDVIIELSHNVFFHRIKFRKRLFYPRMVWLFLNYLPLPWHSWS